MIQPDGHASANTELDTAAENRKLAYHESAHAVLFWNLGHGVQQVWIDRSRHCGNAIPCREMKGRAGRVGYAVASVAGLASAFYVQEKPSLDDVMRATTDFGLALGAFLTTERLTDGEQLALAIALTNRTAVLLREPDVKRQVLTLVPPLLERGALVHRQITSMLSALSGTADTKRKCRQFVTELIGCRFLLIAEARGKWPVFRWVPE